MIMSDEYPLDVAEWDDLKITNGAVTCKCGSLTCVEHLRDTREFPKPKSERIRHRTIVSALCPAPTLDVLRLQCASCGRIIWNETEKLIGDDE